MTREYIYIYFFFHLKIDRMKMKHLEAWVFEGLPVWERQWCSVEVSVHVRHRSRSSALCSSLAETCWPATEDSWARGAGEQGRRLSNREKQIRMSKCLIFSKILFSQCVLYSQSCMVDSTVDPDILVSLSELRHPYKLYTQRCRNFP